MGIIISLTTLNGCMRAVDISLGEQGGAGVVYDTKEPWPLLRKAAEQGDSQAQYNLGVKWYKKSAEQGSASGQYNLGVMY
ncbi:tetratricopeptide repeat protein, partial [Bathymodiolus japonicus methanotrophic gill symbiont]|uniref:tetratricopeptide repeat protein n=1 Tax=Bathymodiolus japonicus methanotrophic gill symbiont TaxID=113269 RepID=UPI003B82F576